MSKKLAQIILSSSIVGFFIIDFVPSFSTRLFPQGGLTIMLSIILTFIWVVKTLAEGDNNE